MEEYKPLNLTAKQAERVLLLEEAANKFFDALVWYDENGEEIEDCLMYDGTIMPDILYSAAQLIANRLGCRIYCPRIIRTEADAFDPESDVSKVKIEDYFYPEICIMPEHDEYGNNPVKSYSFSWPDDWSDDGDPEYMTVDNWDEYKTEKDYQV